jgi:methylmalonyl-CoA carboxyltransferase large subunit
MPENLNDPLVLLAQMREEIDALKRRLSSLEGSVLHAAGPSEEDLLAISAAVAAFLGVRAHIRQVRLLQSSAWAQVGRIGTHASHHPH